MKKVLLNFNLKHGKRRREITKLFLTKTFIFLHFFRSFFLHLLSGKTRKYLIYCQCRRETFPLYVCAVLCCRCTIYVCIMFSVFKTCIFLQLNFVLTYMYELKTEKNKKEKPKFEKPFNLRHFPIHKHKKMYVATVEIHYCKHGKVPNWNFLLTYGILILCIRLYAKPN